MRIAIRVPGEFDGANAFLDLETAKVPTGGFVMKNGEALKNRWSVILAGCASAGYVTLYDNQEDALLAELAEELVLADEVVYAGTRDFDEMICKGRFTNARRAHEDRPFFPAVPGADGFRWRNVRPTATERAYGLGVFERGEDVPSRDVPARWARGDRTVVLVHLLRDVAELVLLAGDPDSECEAWCRRVLVDYDFAAGLL